MTLKPISELELTSDGSVLKKYYFPLNQKTFFGGVRAGGKEKP